MSSNNCKNSETNGKTSDHIEDIKIKMNGEKYTDHWPKDVGIVNMVIYFPSLYVDQTDLEKFDQVSEGKYTVGLGQSRMGFCSDREDINSLCLTVTHSLLEKSNISPAEIGFLMVGTETLVDKSKSVKSVLMQLFEGSGNSNIEGLDTTNACYGGTAALFSAINWIESSSWDGRYAIVVAADIATYASGPARPSGGAGAVAMLIGPNAPLVMIRNCRATHMAHTWDFYKPYLASEYPVVEGKASIVCYTQSVDKCYELFTKKYQKVLQSEYKKGQVRLEDFDALLFHSPYCKLVQKSVARLVLNEFWREEKPDFEKKYKGLEKYHSINLEESYFDKDLEKSFLKVSQELYNKKTLPSLLIATQVGNMYTASLYSCLISYLLSKPLDQLAKKRILLFSYGSGMAASMFVMEITKDFSKDSKLYQLYESIKDVPDFLKNRIKIKPQVFVDTLKLKEDIHQLCPYTPTGSIDRLFPRAYYLSSVDEQFRRKYKRNEVY